MVFLFYFKKKNFKPSNYFNPVILFEFSKYTVRACLLFRFKARVSLYTLFTMCFFSVTHTFLLFFISCAPLWLFSISIGLSLFLSFGLFIPSGANSHGIINRPGHPSQAISCPREQAKDYNHRYPLCLVYSVWCVHTTDITVSYKIKNAYYFYKTSWWNMLLNIEFYPTFTWPDHAITNNIK